MGKSFARFNKQGMSLLALFAACALLYAREILNAGVPLYLCLFFLIIPVYFSVAGAKNLRYAFLLVCFCLLAGALASLRANIGSEKLEAAWRQKESRLIASTLLVAGEKVNAMEKLSSEMGERTKEYISRQMSSSSEDSVSMRLNAFKFFETLTEELEQSKRLPAGKEIGIQLFDVQGKRIAWAGWPQALSPVDKYYLSKGRDLVYSRQVSLYQILTQIIPVRKTDGEQLASIVVEIPLEANYKVNNKFIKGTSLADDIDSRLADKIDFEYYPVSYDLLTGVGGRKEKRAGREHDGFLLSGPEIPAYIQPVGAIAGDKTSGLSGEIVVSSALGNPLIGIKVQGHTFRHFVERFRGWFSLVAKGCVILALLVLFVMVLVLLPKKPGRATAWVKALVLLVSLVVLRYSLLSIQTAPTRGGLKIFDPVIFATPILHGLMRSAGDLLVTSVFLVVAIYGVLKIARSTEPVSKERSSPAPRWFFILKALASTLVLIAFFEISRRFIGAVVVNANPRLLGGVVNLFKSQVVILHLAVFLMLTGFFLTGILSIWGIFRLGGGGDNARTSILAAFLLGSAAVWLWGPVFGILAMFGLLFVFYAPRFVHREDLVSIVLTAFYIVVIISGVGYVYFNDEYQSLRKIFIQEKAAELANPSDNWKAFVIEDILGDVSKKPALRKALRQAREEDVQRLSFDFWAESPLSLLGYSSAIYVMDREDSVVSRFAVDMPFRARFSDGGERIDAPSGKNSAVLNLMKNTSRGIVRFYRGIVNIEDFMVEKDGQVEKVALGRVIIDVPYFFENLSWAARTGPRTPEILRNVQEGGVEPRLEEPEALLLARLKGALVLESSSDDLPAGFQLDREKIQKAENFKWPLLPLKEASYRFMVGGTEDSEITLLAGFKVPSPLWHGLRWSTLLSLYMIFTIGIIAATVFLKQLPVFNHLLPSLTPGRRLGFQQKLLASFFMVAILPAIILGVFSIRMIKARFVQENKKEALSKAFSAKKTLVNTLHEEFRIVAGSLDIEAIMAGESVDHVGIGGSRLIMVFAGDVDEAFYSSEEIFVAREGGDEYIGVFSSPFTIEEDGVPGTYFIYYARKLDGELLEEVADQVGADVNIYDQGLLAASSREGLLASGLVSPVMNTKAFTNVSLMGVDHTLTTESAGRYSYQVAYLPLEVTGSDERAALSLPLLFRPESYHVEVQKATSVVFGIFALLFAATIGLGLVLARGIFEPLRDLLEGTKRIARGEFSFKLPLKKRDEIGTVVAAFNEMTDQLSRSQTALEERRRYLEAILANIGTGVISTDAEDRITTLNEAAEKILGLPAGDALGMRPGELAGKGVVPEFFSALKGSTRTQQPFRSSEVAISKAGQRCTIKYMHTRLSFEDRYLGAVFVFEDLTELINSKKLSAWVEMARQIAHEIKNPLTPIKLSIQFMVKAYDQKSTEFDKIFRESSSTIIHQVDVLKRIAGEFSSFGKMQKLTVKPHGLAPLLEDIVRPYRKNTSGVEISLRLSSLDTRVMVDPEALRKICANLIENALEAMPGGGKLSITGEETTANGERIARLSFIDAGPGLSEDAKEKLFEPYFSTKTTGTGLGLAICRTLSKEMGGDVTVEDLHGKTGAVATVILQVATED